MKSRFPCHSWTAVILLVALLVPRCLMAAEIVAPKAAVSPPPCHGNLAPAKPRALAQLTCAQQCEQSLVSSPLVKASDVQIQPPAALASTHSLLVLSLSSTVLHQGWPPDNQLWLPRTPNLYLDTGRLRL